MLEATQMLIHPANRGAVWFRATVEGKSVHMGRIREGVNAIEKVVRNDPAHAGLRARSWSPIAPAIRCSPEYECPAQVNIGTMHAGDWPSAVAGFAVVEGGVGFLPNKRMETVKRELHEAVMQTDDEWLKTHFQLEFPKLHNDAYEIPADHPLPLTMQAGCEAVGLGVAHHRVSLSVATRGCSGTGGKCRSSSSAGQHRRGALDPRTHPSQ